MDITIISGMLGSGTTYYTNYLNHLAGEQVAWHEHIYGVKGERDPKPGQLYEVSGFSFPHATDILLVRDPRSVIRGLRWHEPHYQNYTEKYLGYRANTLAQFVSSYLEFTRMALARDPEVLRIEDVPVIEELNRNRTGHGRRKPHTWDEIGGEVTSLAKGWGY
jgi:hypothetical protein